MTDLPKEHTGTQTISRAFKALKIIAGQLDHGIRMTDLAAAMQLSKPTTSRLLKALVNENVLTQSPTNRRFRLGPMIYELGLASNYQFNLRELCEPILRKLVRETGDSCFFSVRNRNESVCINCLPGIYEIDIPMLPIGYRLPLGANCGGMSILANLGEEERERILHEAEAEFMSYGMSKNLLRKLIDQTQKQGYAHFDSYTAPGVSSIGVPIISESGTIIAAIALSCTQTRMTNKHVKEIVPHAQKAVEDILKLLEQQN